MCPFFLRLICHKINNKILNVDLRKPKRGSWKDLEQNCDQNFSLMHQSEFRLY